VPFLACRTKVAEAAEVAVGEEEAVEGTVAQIARRRKVSPQRE